MVHKHTTVATVLFGVALIVHTSIYDFVDAKDRNASPTHDSIETESPLPQPMEELGGVIETLPPLTSDFEIPQKQSYTEPDTDTNSAIVTPPKKADPTPQVVPFFSQFADITSSSWQKVGCGIASLAMLIEFYKPSIVNVDTLLDEGVSAGAYISNVGWSYAGLIGLAQTYGLDGKSYDLGGKSMESAYAEFENALQNGPVIASVHYTFDPRNPIPHLVVINAIRDGIVFYNDPADSSGSNTLSVEKFQNAWKKRYIEIRDVS